MAAKKEETRESRKAAHQKYVEENNAKLAKLHPDNPALRPAPKPKRAKPKDD